MQQSCNVAGTGLFIGSGSALGDGGPLGILIAWIIMGVMLLNTCQAIGEMAIMYPVSGGFYTLISRFVDPSWGFAMGWNYWFQWVSYRLATPFTASTKASDIDN